jgi:hypothetical protein
MAAQDGTIDHGTLVSMAKAGAISRVTLAGDSQGWAIIARVRETRYPLAVQTGGVRHFRHMEAAARYLRQVGVEKYEVDQHAWDPRAPRNNHRRPDTAAAMKRAHEAAEYDRWFCEEVDKAVREADSPDAVWYTHEEVEAEFAERRARIRRRLAGER